MKLSFETSHKNHAIVSFDGVRHEYEIDDFISEEYITKVVTNFLLNDYFIDDQGKHFVQHITDPETLIELNSSKKTLP